MVDEMWFRDLDFAKLKGKARAVRNLLASRDRSIRAAFVRKAVIFRQKRQALRVGPHLNQGFGPWPSQNDVPPNSVNANVAATCRRHLVSSRTASSVGQHGRRTSFAQHVVTTWVGRLSTLTTKQHGSLEWPSAQCRWI